MSPLGLGFLPDRALDPRIRFMGHLEVLPTCLDTMNPRQRPSVLESGTPVPLSSVDLVRPSLLGFFCLCFTMILSLMILSSVPDLVHGGGLLVATSWGGRKFEFRCVLVPSGSFWCSPTLGHPHFPCSIPGGDHNDHIGRAPETIGPARTLNP